MELHVKKLELIQWIAGIDDLKLISQFVDFKQSNLSKEDKSIVNHLKKVFKTVRLKTSRDKKEIRQLALAICRTAESEMQLDVITNF